MTAFPDDDFRGSNQQTQAPPSMNPSSEKSERPIMFGPTKRDMTERLVSLRKKYQLSLQLPDGRDEEVARVSRLFRDRGTLVDLGGGVSAHNGVLAQLGMNVYVIDMFGAYWEHSSFSSVNSEMRLLEECGVRFIQHDLSTVDLEAYFAAATVDVVTSFHCLEHLHRSPRMMLESAIRILKPGGSLVIEVPNAANARKRMALLCGRTNYESYNSFYYTEPFLGHVREYTVGDVRQLARNLGAIRYRISGRNTIYGGWANRIPSIARKSVDHALKFFPGLCSSLVLEITIDGTGRATALNS